MQVQAESAGAYEIGGLRVAKQSRARFTLQLNETFAATAVETPVEVAHGGEAGPVLCLLGGVHGDEIDGIEVVRQVQQRLDVTTLRGTVITVPLVNVTAFENRSRYLPDRRDLNRAFPGSANGSLAARIAYRLMREVITHCELLVDVHSGSGRRTNLPQIRADMRSRETVALALALAPLTVLHKVPGPKTLRVAALDHEVPTVTVEVGEANRLDVAGIMRVVQSIESLIARMPSGNADSHCTERTGAGSTARGAATDCAPMTYFRSSSWLRARTGGLFVADQSLGARVTEGQVLGRVIDINTHEDAVIRARKAGLVIGRAVDQAVLPGFGLFHIASDETPVSVLP